MEATILHEDAERGARRDRARDASLRTSEFASYSLSECLPWNVEAHSNYWGQYPGNYDHAKFGDGFVQGWEDAWVFYRSIARLPQHSTVPELGFRGPWVKKRAHEYEKDRGSNSLWEYGRSYVSDARRQKLSNGCRTRIRPGSHGCPAGSCVGSCKYMSRSLLCRPAIT